MSVYAITWDRMATGYVSIENVMITFVFDKESFICQFLSDAFEALDFCSGSQPSHGLLTNPQARELTILAINSPCAQWIGAFLRSSKKLVIVREYLLSKLLNSDGDWINDSIVFLICLHKELDYRFCDQIDLPCLSTDTERHNEYCKAFRYASGDSVFRRNLGLNYLQRFSVKRTDIVTSQSKEVAY